MALRAQSAVAAVVVLAVGAVTVGALQFALPDGQSRWATSSDDRATPYGPDERSNLTSGGLGDGLVGEASAAPDAVSRGLAQRAQIVPVTLSLNAVELEITTSALTVSDLLGEYDVVLDGYAVSHELDQRVEAGMRVVVARVAWSDATEEREIPFNTVETQDPRLGAGQRIVTTAGKPGRAVTTYLVASIDGMESSRSEVVSVVLAEAVHEQVRVGTKTDDPTSAPPTADSPTIAPPAPPAADPAPSADPTVGPATEPTADPDGDNGADPAPSGNDDDATAKPTPRPTPPPAQPPTGTEGTTPASAKALAKKLMGAYGWTGKQYTCLANLWEKESNWNYRAANPTSSARGIAQAMMSVHFGSDWRTSAAGRAYLNTPRIQIDWGLRYISGRYSEGPCGAWEHSVAKGWY